MHESAIHISLAAEKITSVFGIPITNSLIAAWTVMGLLFVLVFLFRRTVSLVPGKIQTLVEWGVEGVQDYMEEALENKALAKRFFPLIATIFVFVFFMNELEFVPGFGSIGFFRGEEFVPLFRAATTDLNTTLALALIAFFTIEFTGVAMLGVLKYGGKFVTFKSPLAFAIGLIELVSNLARLISFSFRLFGNIFAGEVLVLVAAFFVPLVLPVPVMLFELFVGFIQAAIFALLTLFFIKIAVTEEH